MCDGFKWYDHEWTNQGQIQIFLSDKRFSFLNMHWNSQIYGVECFFKFLYSIKNNLWTSSNPYHSIPTSLGSMCLSLVWRNAQLFPKTVSPIRLAYSFFYVPPEFHVTMITCWKLTFLTYFSPSFIDLVVISEKFTIMRSVGFYKLLCQIYLTWWLCCL